MRLLSWDTQSLIVDHGHFDVLHKLIKIIPLIKAPLSKYESTRDAARVKQDSDDVRGYLFARDWTFLLDAWIARISRRIVIRV